MLARAYYNEIDSYAADWLRNLSAAGHIAPGDVDTRSIVDVRPADVVGHRQCHFFAGIAGWSLALRLAGWPDDLPVWTGSCPCQPFSAAGRRGGFDDERHLWPAWFALIRAVRPPVVFGEQVEAAVRLGWLDAVFSDLEGEGYTCGAVVLGAHSVGAPHIRQRLWFVAYAGRERCDGQSARLRRAGAAGWDAVDRPEVAGCGEAGIVADSIGSRLEGRDARPMGLECEAAERGGAACGLGDAERERVRSEGRRSDDGAARGMPHPNWQRERVRTDAGPAGAISPWSDLVWLPCRDGKARPTRPGLFPLAHGIPARVGKLRAAGNAIVPWVAATFIRACLDVIAASALTPQPEPKE